VAPAAPAAEPPPHTSRERSTRAETRAEWRGRRLTKWEPGRHGRTTGAATPVQVAVAGGI